MVTMDRWTILGCLMLSTGVYSRGPVCLHGTGVSSPETLTNVTECWPWESCFAEHFVDREGNEGYNFGCRVKEQCSMESNTDPTKISLCRKCCSGDVCNTDICAAGTVHNRGIACLNCDNSPTIPTCNQVTYCNDGEVCFGEQVHNGPVPTYNIGCLKKTVCDILEQSKQMIGRRATTSCHECCETAGCNRDACTDHESTTTAAVTQRATTTAAYATTTPTQYYQTTTQYYQTTTTPQYPPTTHAPARDCWDLRHIHHIIKDGVYNVLAPSGRTVAMRCDMTTDGGGWIVFQKRHKGTVNFNRNWAAYKGGFGTLQDHDEFWMGNDAIHEFTKDGMQKLRVDICSWPDTHRFEVYNHFYVGPEYDKYKLSVSDCHGDAGDALIAGSGHQQKHDKMFFSTPDRDNDCSAHHCAADYYSGFWFGDCFSANPNGIYKSQGFLDPPNQGMQWRPWVEGYSFRGMEWKFRPRTAPGSGSDAFNCPIK